MEITERIAIALERIADSLDKIIEKAEEAEQQ